MDITCIHIYIYIRSDNTHIQSLKKKKSEEERGEAGCRKKLFNDINKTSFGRLFRGNMKC